MFHLGTIMSPQNGNAAVDNGGESDPRLEVGRALQSRAGAKGDRARERDACRPTLWESAAGQMKR